MIYSLMNYIFSERADLLKRKENILIVESVFQAQYDLIGKIQERSTLYKIFSYILFHFPAKRELELAKINVYLAYNHESMERRKEQ